MSYSASGILFGLGFTGIGALFAFNLGGFAAWHTRLSYGALRFLRDLPPWRWFVKADDDTIIKREIRRARTIGVVFLAAGLGLLVVSVQRTL